MRHQKLGVVHLQRSRAIRWIAAFRHFGLALGQSRTWTNSVVVTNDTFWGHAVPAIGANACSSSFVSQFEGWVSSSSSSRPDSPIRPRVRQVDWDKVLRQIRNSWIVQLGKWWEHEGVQSSLCFDSCLPRLRSRRLGGSRAGRWTWSSMLRKRQQRPLMGGKPVRTGSDPAPARSQP